MTIFASSEGFFPQHCKHKDWSQGGCFIFNHLMMRAIVITEH